MHGKPAEFVLQVHGDHPLTLVLGCLHVAHEALLLQLRNGKRNGIRADGDVTVLAEVHGFHDLNTVGGEVGGIALLHAERKRLVQLLADSQRVLAVFTVDADVRHFKAERGRSCLLAKLRDLLKITRRDVRLRADPTAADRVNKGRGDELADVLTIHAAGRDKLDPTERAGQRLHRGQTAVNAGREELHNVQSQLHGCHNFGRGHAAGRDGNAVFHAPADDFLVKARRNDKLRAALDRLLHCSSVMTVPAPTSISGQLSATALIESAAAAVRNVISITSTPPASRAFAVATASFASSNTTTGTTAAILNLSVIFISAPATLYTKIYNQE